ncbi:bifunctional protein-serine/threonine kinase/phosphatase [Psychromonas sp. MME2]|uniref:bifunctional protein-serine/threonine kinase/phosphatase n=1 Tax=unclassified Psychromonas TaxID=2614957 RepID=UPI00339CCCB5
MEQALAVSIGQATDKGIKKINQDAMGYVIPNEPLLSSKGVVLAMADGISSSHVSQIASDTAVASFLADYYCTSDSWSVNTSAQKVIKSINHWLYAQTANSPYRYEKDKGYIATFSTLIIKSNTAHLLHCGDTRILRISDNQLVQLTQDHRRVVSSEVSYLTRALGIDPALDIDYHSEIIAEGDLFILATDGVYEFVSEAYILATIAEFDNLTLAAERIIEQAMLSGSDDNLTIQIVKIEKLPNYQLSEVQQHVSMLPLPPRLTARMVFDGYTILREIYISSRSHVFLASDIESQQLVVIKTPSTELRNDKQYLERFMLEEWIAKRINNPHVVKAIEPTRKRNFLYLVSEYIEGISLKQWMIDNPQATINQVRDIIGQVAKGLQAFHRQEMVHQDLRPDNIMIDHNQTVKIIDFGSTFIAGVTDIKNEEAVRGTMRYSAPEYFLGEVGTARSDIYALAVITYQMLSGRFPYHAKIAQVRSLSAQRRLSYTSLINDDTEFPIWIDDTLRKALNVEPAKRYAELSEFIHDLKQPNKRFINRTSRPLIERNPVLFWQGMSFILLLIIVAQWLI